MQILRSRWIQALALFLLVFFTQLPVMVDHFAVSMIDPDIWWHLRVGDSILQSHAFPHTGIFSQYQGPWIAYSWGFEVLMSSLFRTFGLAALPLTLILLRAAIIFSIFLVLFRISNRFWTALLLSAAAIYPVGTVLVIRPVLFTVLFFTIELGLIFEYRRTGSIRPLYWIPPLFLVWGNMHIQFVYGIAALGLFVLSEWLQTFFPRLKSSLREFAPQSPSRLGIVLVLSILATLIGPYWGKAYLVALGYARSTYQFGQIHELLALNFRDPSDYVVLLLLMAGCYRLGRRGPDLFPASLLFISALVSFRAARDEWFVTLVASVLIAESLRPPGQTETSRNWMLQAGGSFGLAVVAGFAVAQSIGLTPNNLIIPLDRMYPVRATEFIREKKLPGPMYNSFNWGGFLIFNLREYPVSIDGRTDLHPAAALARAHATLNGTGWNNDPDLARANFVILEKTQPLASILASDPGFQLAYSDHLAVVLVRRSSP